MLLPLSSSREAGFSSASTSSRNLPSPITSFASACWSRCTRRMTICNRRGTWVIRHEIAPCPASGEHLALYLLKYAFRALADRQAQIVDVRRRVRALDFEQAVVADQPVRDAPAAAFDTDKPGFVNQSPCGPDTARGHPSRRYQPAWRGCCTSDGLSRSVVAQ